MKLIETLGKLMQMDEDYPESWNIDDFKNLSTFYERIKYCNQHLKKIGAGSSRIVYQIDNEKVLKLAKNRKGLTQNEVEINLSNDSYIDHIVAKVFDSDENNKWLEMELVRKLTNSEFKKIIGYSFEDYSNALRYQKNPQRRIGFFSYSKPENFDELWENEFISDMFDFISNYDVVVGDLTKLSSYGIAKSNGSEKIVLVDYGLNDMVWAGYYQR